MFQFISGFINNRIFQTQVCNKLFRTPILQNGTPRGSVSSYTLLLIMINDIDVKNVELFVFADDSRICKSGRNLKSLHATIQENLNLIGSWCKKWALKISSSKTVAVTFTRKRKRIKNLNPLKIHNSTINFENKVKFLGMIFESNLTWLPHAKYIEDKCNKRINLMRSLASAK